MDDPTDHINENAYMTFILFRFSS